MRAVLRQAPLRDVERGHDLDARGERRLEARRRLHDVVEDAVDAEADSQIVLEGLDVDVARSALDRVGHQRVDELDERRLLGCPLQRGEIEGVFGPEDLDAAFAIEVGERFVVRLGAGVVVAVDCLLDAARGREHDADVAARQELTLVEPAEVGGIRHRQRERRAREADRQHLVLAGERMRDQREHLGQRLDAQRIDDRKPVLLVEVSGEVVFRHEAEADQRGGELPAVPVQVSLRRG